MGVDLPLSTILHAPTTAGLAALIDGPPEQRIPLLVQLRPGHEGLPLFVVHALLPLRPLVLRLRTKRPVFGLEERGLEPSADPQTRIRDMAQANVNTIRSVQPHGPYALVGYSFSGLVAFEMARRLAVLGEEVDMLALIDTEVHHACLPAASRWLFLIGLPFRAARSVLSAPRTQLPQHLRTAVRRVAPRVPVAPSHFRHRLGAIDEHAFAAYRPRPYAGSATLFVAAARRARRCNPTAVWRRALQDRLAVEHIPGAHHHVGSEPTVSVLAERMSAHLESRGAEGSSD
jgi:acetoacetyl-CoA synthetase